MHILAEVSSVMRLKSRRYVNGSRQRGRRRGAKCRERRKMLKEQFSTQVDTVSPSSAMFLFAWGGENAITHAQWPASLGYVGVGRMSLPYPLKTPPPSSSALRADNPGKTCRQSSGLFFRAPLSLLLRAVTAHVIFSASSEYWADLLLRFFVVLYSCLHCSAQLLLHSFSSLPLPRPSLSPSCDTWRSCRIAWIYSSSRSLRSPWRSDCPRLSSRQERSPARSFCPSTSGTLCIVVRVSTVETVAVAVLANPFPIDTEAPMPG